MLRTYTGGEKVPGGFYFNLDDWTMRVAPREGEVLPGDAQTRYRAFPTVAMLVAAPILSFVFVIFLPFIGMAMLAKVALTKAGLVWKETREAGADKVRVRVTK